MSETKSKIKSILKKIVFTIVVVGLSILSFFYFGTYSRGDRVGKIVKVSEKGFIFKTVEGQLNVESFGAVRSQNMFSETFEFSIRKNDSKVIDSLKAAMTKGRRVNIHYVEKYWKVPWRGDTKYFVRNVTILEN